MSSKDQSQRRTRKTTWLLLVLAVGLAVAAAVISVIFDESGGGVKDGYYTAQLSSYDDEGWREYLTIFVNDGKIATAELNATNQSGMLRSWDQEFIHQSHIKYNITPNHFSRLYCGRLVSFQDPAGVLPSLPGRRTHEIFIKLAEAALRASRAGRLEVVEIERPETNFPDDI